MNNKNVMRLVAISLFFSCISLSEVISTRNLDISLVAVDNAGYVRFQSNASNSGPGKTISINDCYVHDQLADQTYINCDHALEAAFQGPFIHDPKLVASKNQSSNHSHIGAYYVYYHYQALKLRIAIKKSAFESPVFKGIGFYLNEFRYTYYQPRPAAGSATSEAFIPKEKLSLNSNQTRTNKLDGQEMVIIEVNYLQLGNLGGSTRVTGAYLRPYASFDDGVNHYHNYDNVSEDYFINYGTLFDRSSDVLN